MKIKNIILASNSPRRKELLEDTGLVFAIHSAECEEYFDSSLEVATAIENIAYEKAKAVLQKFPNEIVIGADTMVICNQHILGKPKKREDAFQMLSMLSGKCHEVISGVAILTENIKIIFHEKTMVTFYTLDESMINWYIDTMEPFDKAGAYGIQGKGKLLVKKICGDYYNVMGLPIAKVYREIKKLQKD